MDNGRYNPGCFSFLVFTLITFMDLELVRKIDLLLCKIQDHLTYAKLFHTILCL